MTALITGASGFLGGHLCREWQARGVSVRGLVRDTSVLPEEFDVAVVSDLNDRDGIRQALRGVDTVVHLAARVHVMREASRDPLTAFRRVNVEGTRILLDESIAAGVQRFVYFSSIKAVGEANDQPWTESVHPEPVDPYGVSKLEAEELVRTMAMEASLHAPILRLPLSYGPGVGANMLRLFRAVARGIPLPFASVRNLRSLAFWRTVAAATHAVLDSPRAGQETFFVSDDEDVSTPELLRIIGHGLGRSARMVPVPVPFLRLMGAVGDAIDRVVPMPVTSVTFDRLVGSLTVSVEKLKTLTGFTPPCSLQQGMDETAHWYQDRWGHTYTSTRAVPS